MVLTRLLRPILVAAFALTPAACSEFRDVRLTGSLEQPQVHVLKVGSMRPVSACVDWVVVFESVQNLRSPLWRIRSADGKCVELDSLTYGEAPQGFVTDTPAQPLRPGVAYDIGGHGWTRGWLPSVPWIGGGIFVFEDGEWRQTSRR